MTPGSPLGFEDKVFTVAEYIDILNTFFKAQAVKITGEIAELKRAASGHVYFTIKDKTNAGVLDCIIWARNYQMCGVVLEVGMELILSGHANVYAPSGRLSFVADTVELVGEGALKKAYDELRRKLEAEGVFAPERKRALPEYPQRIGVITSLKGAVIHDFENNLGKCGFKVIAVDSRVEGQQAVKPLLAAVEAMRGQDIEVLVIIRGGGSLESLQGFNNEMLVRAVMDFPVPVIAGIGHDQDVPLVQLAADFMVSTPTAAAHLLSRPWADAYAKVREFAGLVDWMPLAIQKTRSDLARRWDGLANAFARRLESARQTVAMGSQLIKHNDPARQLSLGYSIARKNGKVIRSTAGLAPGEAIELTVRDGRIDSAVTHITHLTKDHHQDYGKNHKGHGERGGTGKGKKPVKPQGIPGGHQEDLGLV